MTAPGTRIVPVRRATPADVEALAALAAATFPLACPPGTPPEAIAAHLRERLNPDAVAAWIADTASTVLVVDGDGELVGYALATFGPCSDAEAAASLGARGIDVARVHELSKIYVRAAAQGRGVAGALLEATVAAALAAHGDGPVWLGTNALNGRAQAFYGRHGFVLAGTRTYVVGGRPEADVVMLREAP